MVTTQSGDSLTEDSVLDTLTHYSEPANNLGGNMSDNDPLERVLDSLHNLHRKVDNMADALADSFTALSSSVDDLSTKETAAISEIQKLAGEVKDIQPGTSLTADQVTALADRVKNVSDALNTATTSAEPAPAAAPPATDPTAAVAPAVPSPAQQAVDQITHGA